MSQVTGTPSPSDGQPDAPPAVPAAPPRVDADSSPPAATPRQPTVPSTRTGIVWWAAGFSMLLLVLVLVFVLQNLSVASTSFFSVKWTIPLGLDLLLAALLGGLIVFLLGVARMLQLRRLARHYARHQRRGE